MVSLSDSFELFTSLRYDPILTESEENGSDVFNFEAKSPFYMLKYHRDRMLEAALYFDWAVVARKLSNGKAFHGELLQGVEQWQEETKAADGPLKVRVLFSKEGELQVELNPVSQVSLDTLYPLSFDPPKPKPSNFKPSPLTGGALELGPDDQLLSQQQTTAWTLTLDTEPTKLTEHTSLKTTRRAHYVASRHRALPPNSKITDEVLMYGICGELTECTFTSVYVFRGGRWVTPPVGPPSTLTPKEAPVPSPEANNNSYQPRPDEGELRDPFPGRWGHSIRASAKLVGIGGQRGTTRRWALKKGLCMEEPIHKDTVKIGELAWVSNGVRGFAQARLVA